MIRVAGVSHFYGENRSFQALKNIELELDDKCFIILFGQSGSGKTTLLNVISGLMKPAEGQVFHDDEELYRMSEKDLCRFRNRRIGFIFQDFLLENNYSALENVMVPLFANREMKGKEQERGEELLRLVGLQGKENNRPTELSGGECQRVAIARALANDPSLIIADEPTGNLDSTNGDRIIALLKEMVENGKTVIMVTHNADYLKYADRVINLKDGAVL